MAEMLGKTITHYMTIGLLLGFFFFFLMKMSLDDDVSIKVGNNSVTGNITLQPFSRNVYHPSSANEGGCFGSFLCS